MFLSAPPPLSPSPWAVVADNLSDQKSTRTAQEAIQHFWPAPLHDSSSIFLGGATLQPPALPNKHHPRNIPAQEEPSPRKAGGQSQGVVHGNDATPAESMRENTAGCSPTQQRVCVHTARPGGAWASAVRYGSLW